jgi:hypothetical protein
LLGFGLLSFALRSFALLRVEGSGAGPSVVVSGAAIRGDATGERRRPERVRP